MATPDPRIVICRNDHPHALMPAGSTMEQAEEVCRILQRRDATSLAQACYHAHEIPEIAP